MFTTKRFDFQKLLALGALVLIYIFFAIFGRNFFSSSYALVILGGSYYIGFLAIGVTFVIITGGIDLSIGTVMVCSSLIGSIFYNSFHLPLMLALIIVVSTGTLLGC